MGVLPDSVIFVSLLLRSRGFFMPVDRYCECLLAGDAAPDNKTLNVVGALVNLANAHVAVDALDREVEV
jgi:hypothetical protein